MCIYLDRFENFGYCIIMKIQKVCITETEYLKGLEIFEKAKEFLFLPVKSHETTLAEAIKYHGVSAVVVGIDTYTGPLYEAMPIGGVIIRFGVGCDGLDQNKATVHKLLIVNTPHTLYRSVAELTIGLMCALVRNYVLYQETFRSAVWSSQVGQDLSDKQLLIIGCGKIGTCVAKIASFGFGMRVLGFDIHDLNREVMKKECGIEMVSDLDIAITQSDFISLHIPLLNSTKHFVNANFLAKMNRSSYLINTSRGSVVDENALYDALVSHQIAGAALDVFETEPYRPQQKEKDLRMLKNVILTPHIGSNTHQANIRMAMQIVSNLRHIALRQYDRLNIVNKDVLSQLISKQLVIEIQSSSNINDYSFKLSK